MGPHALDCDAMRCSADYRLQGCETTTTSSPEQVLSRDVVGLVCDASQYYQRCGDGMARGLLKTPHREPTPEKDGSFSHVPNVPHKPRRLTPQHLNLNPGDPAILQP